jgi:succinoglycan biosynthesis transport protein ExoP
MKQIPGERYYPLPPPEYLQLVPQEEKEINLRDYWKVIRKRRWTIFAFFLIVVVTTAIGTFTMRPIYRATAMILINKENPQIVNFKEVVTVNTMDLDYYQTQYRILESRTLAKKVAHTLRLGEHPEFLPQPETSPVQVWMAKARALLTRELAFLGQSSPEGEEGKQDTLQETKIIHEFLSKLKIEPIRNSRLVKVHFDSHYPELSTRVPNTLAAAYIQQNLENRFTSTEQAKEWLTRQLEELKGKVERADEILQAFGSKHDIISLEEKENLTMQRLAELNETLAKAESERMAKEALYLQTQERHFDALPSILGNKLIQELKQTNIQLEAQYMKLGEKNKPDYPEMRRLKNQIETMQKRLQAEIQKIITGIKIEYDSSLRKESLLRAVFEEQKAKAMEMKQKAIQYNILKRESDTNKELYKGLLQRMKEAGISAGITASNIQVVDQAELPARPYRPNKQLNLLLASVIGLFLGVGMAFFVEYLDNTVKTSEDVEEAAGLPSFGMVPEISQERQKLQVAGKPYPVELITHGHPQSMLSESYRNVRTSILLSFAGKPPKTMVISSPNPAEGKTTTAINTAIALSQTGSRVIIIDADMRNPRVHRVLARDHGTGLSNFLSGNSELESIIRSSQAPNFCYIPAGPIPPNPSELIGSSLFKNMIQSLGDRFDQILFDSPPVLGFADTTILSTLVDGVILVVVAGKTPKENLQRTKEMLAQVDARILGVVINRVDIRRSNYGSYYKSYHYYYGSGKKKKELPPPAEEKNILEP